MKTKNIIQRNLPLDVKYILIDKSYLSIENGGGCSCDNCGKLITNVATIKNESNKVYNVGFDCLETFFINNSLLDNKSVEDAQHFRKNVTSYVRKSNEIKEFIDKNNKFKISQIEFDVEDFKNWCVYGKTTLLTFNYIFDLGKKYNSYIRVKNDININDFFNVLKGVTNCEILTITK